MKMSGTAHAVLGTFANDVFQDTYADQKFACMPACYKVRPLCYEVMNHSFDFWAQSWASKPTSAARETDQQSNSVEVPAGFTLQPSSSYAGFCTSMAEDDASSDCVVCLERPPTFVFKKCGHLGVCGKCRKWMCKEQYNNNKDKNPRCRLLTSKWITSCRRSRLSAHTVVKSHKLFIVVNTLASCTQSSLEWLGAAGSPPSVAPEKGEVG